MVVSHRLRILITSWCNISCSRSTHSSISICLSCWVFSGSCKRAAIRLPKASYTCSMGFKSGEYAVQSIRLKSSLSSSSSTARVICDRALSSIKMKSGPMAPRNRRTWRRTIAIHVYRPSIENVELSSPVQHNASPDKNSRTTVMVSFFDATGIKPCPDLSPNQNALRIASGTEPTLICKENTTPLTVV
ncbi:uncharacterized protein TNCV_3397931 [Trichonephila clavipes]|nr:uncharacterized protein TNCV_3397931 [Trichonephila clavipes]